MGDVVFTNERALREKRPLFKENYISHSAFGLNDLPADGCVCYGSDFTPSTRKHRIFPGYSLNNKQVISGNVDTSKLCYAEKIKFLLLEN